MKRYRTVLVVLVGSCAFAALGYAAALTTASPKDSDRPPPSAPVTAQVELRRISSSVIARGDTGFSDPVAAQIRVSAPVPVITGTPARVGQQVRAGDVLVEVAGRPVFLLPGGLPTYRNLKDKDVGPDVEQLELALAGLGLAPGEVDDIFTGQTQKALRDLYKRAGYRPPTAGLPMSEVTFVPTLPRRLDRGVGRIGAEVADKPALLSGTRLTVSVDLTAADAAAVKRGMRAEIALPDGKTVSGLLGRIRKTPTGATTTVLVPELGSTARQSLRNANVKVTVRLQSTDGKVLVVPLAALSTDAGGVASVVRVDGSGATHAVTVQVGLSAEGFAEVTAEGGGLAVGDRVVVGR